MIRMCVMLVVFAGCLDRGVRKAEAEREATAFLSALGYADDVRVSCADIDTDNNGYVSCTYRANGGTPTAIECGGGGGLLGSTDCKLKMPTLPKQ